MVRDNRIKFYTFNKADLTGDATTGEVDAYTDNPLNGRIQSVYFEGGNWAPAGSVMISVSGTAGGLTATEGGILTMTSGTATGHHLGEDWAVFPRAKTVDTVGVPTSGAGGTPEVEMPIWSNVRVQAGVIGTGSAASGLTIVYI